MLTLQRSQWKNHLLYSPMINASVSHLILLDEMVIRFSLSPGIPIQEITYFVLFFFPATMYKLCNKKKMKGYVCNIWRF